MQRKIKKEKMKARMNILVYIMISIILIIIMVLQIQTVLAIGITPGRTTVFYEPGLEGANQFRVVNNEYKEMDVLLSVEGSFSETDESIKLHETKLHFSDNEESKLIDYDFILPKNMEPGIHGLKVIAIELPPRAEQGTYVKARAAVAHQFRVIVPYPGKYAEVQLDIIEDTDEGTVFIITVSNLGTDTINAYARLDILDSKGKIVASKETDKKTLESMKRGELTVKWNNDVAGEYTAKVTLFYNGKTAETSKKFKIGQRLFSIKRIFVRDFYLGDIAKFAIVVENNWTENIPDVYAKMKLFTYDDDVIGDIKSASEDVDPFSTKTLYAYWDTQDIDEGDYKGNIIVYYGNDTTQRELKTQVKSDSIIVNIIGLTGDVISEKESTNTTQFLLIMAIVVSVLLNLWWFIYFKRKQKRIKQKRKKQKRKKQKRKITRKRNRKKGKWSQNINLN